MNIRETFLNLTQYTVPHGKEDSLKQYLPDGVKRDEFGNYSITIGESETLFTSHLDTVSTKVEKVNHVIEGNIIRTDGTTILGGDNKAGVVILLNMIENGVPGTYYFFAGEEPTAKDGGLYGSKKALKANPEFFKKFKRAVCFDRKHEGSIVIRQMARFTCSNEFVQALQDQFSNHGLEYHPDQTGWYTDTAVFIDVIPEVTNLSAGVYKEHSTQEYVDMAYIERVANAAVKIDWENLPTVRVAKKETSRDGASVSRFKNFLNSGKDKEIFNKIAGYLDMAGFLCLNQEEFDSGVNMIFSKWHEEVRLNIKVEDGIVYFNDKRIGDLKAFEEFAGIGFEQKVDLNHFIYILENIADKTDSQEIFPAYLEKVFKRFGITFEDFEEYYKDPKCQLKGYLKYNPTTKKITLL